MSILLDSIKDEIPRGSPAGLPDVASRPRIMSWLLAGLLLLALIGLWPTLVSLVQLWSVINDYDYCFVIALMCVIWIGREIIRLPAQATLSVESASRVWIWVMALALLCFLEYVLTQGLSDMGAQILIPPILLTIVMGALGWSGGRSLVAPIAYFYFAIPVWDQALPILQQITIYGAKWSMQLAGVAVSVSGDRISIPEGTFQVLYACSGVRYWVVSLALATLMLTMDRVPLRRWPLALLIVTCLSILANCIRVFTVMYAGHLTGMRHYFVSDNHKGLGNVIFVVLLIAIFGVLGRLRRGVDNRPSIHTRVSGRVPRALWAAHSIWGVALVLCGLATFSLRASHSDDVTIVPQIQPLPFAEGQWQGPLPSQSVWLPRFAHPADYKRLSYRSTAGQIEVYLNVYGQQSQHHELVFFDNTPYAPGNWQLVNFGVSNGLRAVVGLEPLLTEQIMDSENRWLVGQLYVVGGHRTAAGLLSQAWYGLSTLTTPAPAGLIALAAQCDDDCDDARRLLRDFWHEQGDALVSAIPVRLF